MVTGFTGVASFSDSAPPFSQFSQVATYCAVISPGTAADRLFKRTFFLALVRRWHGPWGHSGWSPPDSDSQETARHEWLLMAGAVSSIRIPEAVLRRNYQIAQRQQTTSVANG